MKYAKTTLAMCAACMSTTTWADAKQAPLEKITVTSSRVERDINEIASTITIIDAQQIDQQVATDISDLVRYEPGVVVEGGGRFGLSGFNIRGINGDRILMLLDGAPIADEFSFGPALSARRDFVDVDLIDRVEIIRGPASTLYGSDAIGGVVSFLTKDPQQIVDEGESFGGRIKAGYSSVANEFVMNAQLAGVNGDWSWLVNATRREGAETETFFTDNGEQGLARQASNPQDNSTEGLQFKLAYQATANSRFELLVDYLQAESITDVLSQETTNVRGTIINQSDGVDDRERERFQLNYYYSGETLAFDKAQLRAYWQQSASLQTTLEERFGAASFIDATPVLLDRRRDSRFDQRVTGAILQFDKQFTTASVEHYLIYGSELQYTDSEALREGSTAVQSTGALVPEFSVFPARDFPISEARELSFFIHDEISLFNDKLVLSPGLRYDEFKLTPQPDDIFVNANPGVDTAAFDDSQLSLKVGAVYNINANTNAWLQFAEGFRIPPYDDLNIGFTNLAGGYTSLANPDLQPESVDSWELGFRQNGSAVSWSVSAYYNEYENFIESLASLGFDPNLGLLVFQAQNREAVNIKGVDLEATWFLGETFKQLAGWRVQGAITWLDSEDESTGEELDSIIPPQAVLGLGYSHPEQDWGVELVGTFVQRFDQQNDPSLFTAPGFAQFDLLANYQFNQALALNIGVFNLFDRQIINGTEVRGLAADANTGLFTRPGRNVALNASYSF